MSRRTRYWLFVVAVGLVAALVTLVVICAPRTVPLEQCSELYRRFYDTPGIHASFIKNKRINDTIAVDMTLLKAEDSASYVWLLRELGCSDFVIAYFMSIDDMDENSRFTGRYNNGVMIDLPQRRLCAFFDTDNEADKMTVLHENYKEKIKIEEP